MTPYVPGTSRVKWLLANDPAYRALKAKPAAPARKRQRDPSKPRVSIADLAAGKRH